MRKVHIYSLCIFALISSPLFAYDDNGCVSEKCHSDILKEQSSYEYSHPIKGGECTNCHDKHKDNEINTTISLTSRCFSCHREFGAALNNHRTMWHEPVKKGRCDQCHKLHGSTHRKFLVEYFPVKHPDKYRIDYKKQKYNLCWECHNVNIIEDEVSHMTGFRDGMRNLHFIHVKRERGASCVMCHMIHGSSNTKLLRWDEDGQEYTQFQFMKGRYFANESGGTCMPSCHREKKYSRSIK